MLRPHSSRGVSLAARVRANYCVHVRRITTNTAIQRGLRKPSVPFGASRSPKPTVYLSGSGPRGIESHEAGRGGRNTRSTPRLASPDRRRSARDDPFASTPNQTKRSLSPISPRAQFVRRKQLLDRTSSETTKPIDPKRDSFVRYHAGRKPVKERSGTHSQELEESERAITGLSAFQQPDVWARTQARERSDDTFSMRESRGLEHARPSEVSRDAGRNAGLEEDRLSRQLRSYSDARHELEFEVHRPSSGSQYETRRRRLNDDFGHFGQILEGVRNLNRQKEQEGPPEDRKYGDGQKGVPSDNQTRTLVGEWSESNANQVPGHRYSRASRPFKDKDTSNTVELSTHEHRTVARESARAFIAPISIPYTTAASEFLYGYSVVTAAVKANRRKLYNLYCHPRVQRHEGYPALERLARQRRVNLQLVNDSWLPIMDKMSSGRPHNGVILESSPLPRPPIASLGVSSKEDGYFKVTLSHQSREDREINGEMDRYEYDSDEWRHPFILYADGVTDEGNLGGIIRAAYFLGVDAIALPTRTSAPLTHIALKASVGAAEAIPIFSIADPTGFLRDSGDAGWRIYASDAPTPLPIAPFGFGLDSTTMARHKAARQRKLNSSDNSLISFSYKGGKPFADAAPLSRHPTILMMGSEGSGIKASLMARAHFKVGIRGARVVDEIGVDSLNVATASALLCMEFLKRPKAERKGDFLF